jgi:hypothetical protein
MRITRLDANHRLMFVVKRMEVGRSVIVEIHANQDAKKLADRRHRSIPFVPRSHSLKDWDT